jgi:uncharacterized protein YndB with AHSA1/START domain
MPTQKVFKQRVRTRMIKTGESYTTARRQLIAKAPESRATEPEPAPPPAAEPTPTSAVPGPTEASNLVSDESMRRASGHGHEHWFALLDAWNATDRTHTEIARWVHEAQGVDGWWAQNITVAYERARGMRRPGQMADGFQVAVTRTVNVDADWLFAALTDPKLRAGWLPAEMRQRPTRAALTARFDWADPTSRVVIQVLPKGPAKATVALQHEQLPDADAAARFKTQWRAWLGQLKAVLEQG